MVCLECQKVGRQLRTSHIVCFSERLQCWRKTIVSNSHGKLVLCVIWDVSVIRFSLHTELSGGALRRVLGNELRCSRSPAPSSRVARQRLTFVTSSAFARRFAFELNVLGGRRWRRVVSWRGRLRDAVLPTIRAERVPVGVASQDLVENVFQVSVNIEIVSRGSADDGHQVGSTLACVELLNRGAIADQYHQLVWLLQCNANLCIVSLIRTLLKSSDKIGGGEIPIAGPVTI